MNAIRQRLLDLPLLAKLLIPFVVLVLAVGLAGGYLIARDLSSRAAARLDRDLLAASLDVRSFVQERELYVLEAATFAANVEGMPEAMKTRGSAAAMTLLESVLALKPDLQLLVAASAEGSAVAEVSREPGGALVRSSGNRWGDQAVARRALASGTGGRSGGVVRLGERAVLVVAAPVCERQQPCSSLGIALAGLDFEPIVQQAAAAAARRSHGAQAALFDHSGHALAGSQAFLAVPPPSLDDRPVRRNIAAGGRRMATLYSPLVVAGERVGTIALGLPTSTASGSARSAAVRLAVVLLLVMGGIVVVGIALTRYLLGQLHPLVATTSALGRGELHARAPVASRDEIGRLAEVVNDMARQLQSSHETLEQRVRERTEEVRQLLRQRTELFAGISHELRTPLAVILSHATLLRDPSFGQVASGSEVAETIDQSGKQLLALVDDIVELARAESGRLDVSPVDLFLGEVLDAAGPTLRGLASTGSLDFTVGVAPDLVVRADPERLRDVLVNLVGNAVKYTPRGGHVSIHASAADGKVEIAVSDDGIGIGPEVGSRIFEPFFRVPGARAQAGAPSSGLGLALAKQAVEAQGGTIGYTSRMGKGTTFRIVLPSGRARPRPVPTQESPRTRTVRKSNGGVSRGARSTI